MVTLKQLAKELNVSISTVSKALNNSAEIGEETIRRVKELAELYNYKPNKVALSLKQNKTKTIGVIIPDILEHFLAKVLFGIEREANLHGYNIITCISNDSLEKEKESLQLLANGSVDGFILSVAEETQLKNEINHFEHADYEPLILKMDRNKDSQQKIKSFFKKHKPIDGVISADSSSGIIAINTAISLKLKVPKDISVIGFASKSISNLSIPRLTTIRQHAKVIGSNAAKMLIDRLQNTLVEQDVKTKIVKTSYVKSKSTLR